MISKSLLGIAAAVMTLTTFSGTFAILTVGASDSAQESVIA